MILGTANAIGTVISTVGDILGLSNPKDAERKTASDALYAAALNGDSVAEIRLRCLAGDQSALTQAVAAGVQPAGTPCGWATDTAKQYAANLVTKLNTQRAAAGIAGQVASGATAVGLNADPRTYVSTVAGNLPGIGIPSWVWLAGGAAILVWYARRGK